MKESVLHKYFLDELSQAELIEDLKDSQEQSSFDTVSMIIEKLDIGEFQVEAKHLVKLCHAHLNKYITNADLNTIGFALSSSDFFFWDDNSKIGKVVGDVIQDWDNESIGYDINSKNVWLWKNYLENGHLNLDPEELKLKFRNKGRHLMLYQEIDHILWEKWDPIGVSESARDEYQTYTPKIFKMKMVNKSIREIGELLLKFERTSMGLTGNKENCYRVAKIINEINRDT